MSSRTFHNLPNGSAVKNLPANAGHTGDAGLIAGSGRPPEEEMAPTPVLVRGKSHGQEPGGP